MGVNSSKKSRSIIDTEYSLILSSSNTIYRAQSKIEGELQLNIRKKFAIEKKLRIDLIGELIDKHKRRSQIFLTYSYPFVTSHQNGIARIIRNQNSKFPFRIPLGNNLPPSCHFKEFSITYSLEIYHDGKLIPNLRKTIQLAPALPPITGPLPFKTISNETTMTCTLQKSLYSNREHTLIPLRIVFDNLHDKQLQCIIIQLIQFVCLNEQKYDNEIYLNLLNNIQNEQLEILYELDLPVNLPATYQPNRNGQPDNVPLIFIAYEIRLTAQMKNTINANLTLSVPIVFD